jgi:hypothetical protein
MLNDHHYLATVLGIVVYEVVEHPLGREVVYVAGPGRDVAQPAEFLNRHRFVDFQEPLPNYFQPVEVGVEASAPLLYQYALFVPSLLRQQFLDLGWRRLLYDVVEPAALGQAM